MEKALRHNTGKLKWGLVHWPSLRPLVEVLMFGAVKYAPGNWMKPMDKQEILESSMRHLTAMFSGEVLDKESKLPHAGHVMCNMMFYIFHSEKLYESLDNDKDVEKVHKHTLKDH